jgi:hypothetical protein
VKIVGSPILPLYETLGSFLGFNSLRAGQRGMSDATPLQHILARIRQDVSTDCHFVTAGLRRMNTTVTAATMEV